MSSIGVSILAAERRAIVEREQEELFQQQVSVLELAFSMRLVGTRERVEAERDRYRTEGLNAERVAAQMQRVGEAGQGWRIVYPLKSGTAEEDLQGSGRFQDMELEAERMRALAQAKHARADALDQVLQAFANANLLNVDGGTPEASRKTRVSSALERLHNVGSIDAQQYVAGEEIARIVEGMCVSLIPRASTMDGTGGGSTGEADHGGVTSQMSDWIIDMRRRRYLPWAQELRHRSIPIGLVLDVCVHGVALDVARTRIRKGYVKALALLRDGLDRYAAIKASCDPDDPYRDLDPPQDLVAHRPRTTN